MITVILKGDFSYGILSNTLKSLYNNAARPEGEPNGIPQGFKISVQAFASSKPAICALRERIFHDFADIEFIEPVRRFLGGMHPNYQNSADIYWKIPVGSLVLTNSWDKRLEIGRKTALDLNHKDFILYINNSADYSACSSVKLLAEFERKRPSYFDACKMAFTTMIPVLSVTYQPRILSSSQQRAIAEASGSIEAESLPLDDMEDGATIDTMPAAEVANG